MLSEEPASVIGLQDGPSAGDGGNPGNERVKGLGIGGRVAEQI